jgi:virginiamycin B lyase
MRNAFRTLIFPILVIVGAGCATRTLAQTLTEFPLPTSNSDPWHITAGPDGALWFTEVGANKIGRITTAGAITEFPISGKPYDITVGPDGALWFTDLFAKIWRITTAGATTNFPLPMTSAPYGITAGSDGALWFTGLAGGITGGGAMIGRITTTGAITAFPVPTANGQLTDITAGPDGALWFVESGLTTTIPPFSGSIGRITTAGEVTEFPIPTAGSQPEGIAAGPSNTLWFTEHSKSKIGRITSAGVIADFPLLPACAPFGIASGPDGALWFTINSVHNGENSIGRFASNGVTAQFPIPTSNSNPSGIAAGPEDAMWFTENSGNKIGRLGATLAPSPASGNAPLLVSFKATGLPPAASYTIQFGDGASLTYAPNPMPEYLCGRSPVSCVNPTASFSASHTYTVAGAYTATLLGSNNKTLSVTTIGINPSSTEYNRIYPSSHVDPVEVFPTTQGVPEHF